MVVGHLFSDFIGRALQKGMDPRMEANCPNKPFGPGGSNAWMGGQTREPAWWDSMLLRDIRPLFPSSAQGLTNRSISVLGRLLFDVIDHQNLPRPLHLLQLEAKLFFESLGQRNRAEGFGCVG